MGVPGGRWHPQSMSKFVTVKHLLISKKLPPYFEPSKNVIFGGPFWGNPRWAVPPNDVKMFVS